MQTLACELASKWNVTHFMQIIVQDFQEWAPASDNLIVNKPTAFNVALDAHMFVIFIYKGYPHSSKGKKSMWSECSSKRVELFIRGGPWLLILEVAGVSSRINKLIRVVLAEGEFRQ